MSMKLLQAALLALMLCTAVGVAPAQEGVVEPQAEELLAELRRSESIRIFASETRSRPEGISDADIAALNRRPIIDEHFVTLDAAGIQLAFNPRIPVPYAVSIRFVNDTELSLLVERVELVGESRRISGRLRSDELSQVSLVVSGTYALGTLHTSDEIFEFIPTVDDITAVVAVDYRRYAPERDPGAAHRRPEFDTYPHPDTPAIVPTGGTIEMPEPIDAEPYPDTSYVAPEMTVLVLASEHEFDCDANWLKHMAAAYSLELDDVFGGFLTSSVSFRCVDVVENWNNIEAAYEDILGHAQFNDWRQAAVADVVVFLVADGNGYCGFSMGPDYPEYPIDGQYNSYFAEYAVLSMVVEECALGNKSLAHEIGHLFGMKHERFSESGGTSNFCGYGYPIMRGCKPVARTIMAYDGYCTFVNGVTCKRAATFSIAREASVVSVGSGLIEGQTCASERRDHLHAGANNMYQLVLTAKDVAAYWESFSGGGT